MLWQINTLIIVLSLDPPLLVSLNSSTTLDLPNVPPYNTFSLNCTAIVPQGEVTPKTFSWKRRTGHSSEEVKNDSSTVIRIENSNQGQPVSTSVLTVTETAAGTYHFQCRVDLEELNIHYISNEYSISITTFCKLQTHMPLSHTIYFFCIVCVHTTHFCYSPALSTVITGETNPLAAEKYTLTCRVTVTEGVPDNLTAHWSGPGVGMDGVGMAGVTASNISTETQAIASTFTFNLTFNPLRQSHDGNYSCTASLTTVSITNSSQRTISAASK